MKTWQSIVIGVLIGLISAGIIFLVSMRPHQSAIQILPPTQATTILVDVSGQVVEPGVYSLPFNSRVNDGIIAAKGLLPDADTSKINLAAFLQDGEKVFVPSKISLETDTNMMEYDGKIDINHATLEEIDSLPGIGPQKAQQIIDYRETYGNFTQLEDLLYVSGIGQSIIDEIRDKVIFKP